MNIELLKRVAEKMGYKDVQVWHNDKVVCLANSEFPYEFKPQRDPAQLVEMIEWVLDNGWELYKNELGDGYTLMTGDCSIPNNVINVTVCLI